MSHPLQTPPLIDDTLTDSMVTRLVPVGPVAAAATQIQVLVSGTPTDLQVLVSGTPTLLEALVTI